MSPTGDFDFASGPGRLRRWNLLSAGHSASALLRSLALGGLGRRQVRMLDPRWFSDWPAGSAVAASIEVLQVRHAPQERLPHSPPRRLLGWKVDARGACQPLPKASLRRHDPAAQPAQPELGNSHIGRLVLGYGNEVRSHAGTDCFDFLPNQRLRRCAGVLGREARLTDPLAFLRRLRHKGKYRAGRARALLACLEADLKAWLGIAGEGPWRDHEA